MARKRTRRDPFLTSEQQEEIAALKALHRKQLEFAARTLQDGMPVEELRAEVNKILNMTAEELSEPAAKPKKRARRRRTGRSQSIWTMRG